MGVNVMKIKFFLDYNPTAVCEPEFCHKRILFILADENNSHFWGLYL
jgi:hypothetical protein